MLERLVKTCRARVCRCHQKESLADNKAQTLKIPDLFFRNALNFEKDIVEIRFTNNALQRFLIVINFPVVIDDNRDGFGLSLRGLRIGCVRKARTRHGDQSPDF